jgi:hypothetical protein
MRVPVGIDPAETWHVDFCREAAEYAVELWRSVLSAAKEQKDPAKEQTAAAALADAQAELAGYAGGGPMITLGHIPSAKRAEIAGMIADARKLTAEVERALAEQAWRRQVIRWAVRGHSGLKNRAGEEQGFDAEPVTIAGETYRIPTEKQIERYALAGMLGDLANVALRPQEMGEAEKNG